MVSSERYNSRLDSLIADDFHANCRWTGEPFRYDLHSIMWSMLSYVIIEGKHVREVINSFCSSFVHCLEIIPLKTHQLPRDADSVT